MKQKIYSKTSVANDALNQTIAEPRLFSVMYVPAMLLIVLAAGCSKNFSARTVSDASNGKTLASAAQGVNFNGITTLTYSNGSFSLAWDDASSEFSPTIQYKVYKGNFGTFLQSTTKTKLTLSGSGYKAGDTAEFSVRAVDSLKNQSTNTDTKSLTLSSVVDCSTTLSGAAASDTRINLSFNNCKGATIYNLYSTAVDGTNLLLQQISQSKSSSIPYLLTGLTGGTTYRLHVSPCDSSNVCGNDSNTLTTATKSSSYPQFDGVTSAVVASGNTGLTQVDLTWVAGSSNPSSLNLYYHIYYSTSQSTVFSSTPAVTSTSVNTSANGNHIALGSDSTTSVINLSPGTQYYFGVRAFQVLSSGSIVEEQNNNILAASTSTPDTGAVPSIASISPILGAVAGGTAVTILGSNFIPGSSISFDGVSASSEWVSATKMTAVTPAHAMQVVNVAYNSGQGKSASLAAGYSFTSAPAPTIASLNKTQVNQNGGTAVTVNGTNFLSGATITLAGSKLTPSSVTSTTIQFTTAGASAGMYDLTVVNSDFQTVTQTNALNFLATPTITSVTPAVVTTAGSSLITINGTGFVTPMTANLSKAGTTYTCNSPTVVSSTQLTCVSSAAPSIVSVTSVDVTVTNGQGQTVTSTNGISYTPLQAPVISSLSPTAGNAGGGNTITITGSGFAAGSVVKIGTSNCNSVTVVSSTTVTCVPQGGTGAFAVTVTNTDAQVSNSNISYTYTSAASPTILSVSPAIGNISGGLSITISGINFSNTATAKIGTATCSPTSQSTSSIVCTTGASAAGTFAVYVTNTDGQMAQVNAAFTYSATNPPSVTSINPSYSAPAGGGSVTLTGTNFASGATIKIGANTCTAPSFVSNVRYDCTIPAGTAATTVAVTLTNSDGQASTLSNALSYPGPVSLTSISPTLGTANGGASVTLYGSGFINGATATFGGNACASTTVNNSNTITCVTPAAASVGLVNVTVTNPDSQASTVTSAYNYTNPPYLEQIVNNDNLTTGSVIQLYGYRFDSNAQIVLGAGQTACTSKSFISSTHMTCTLPALSAGNQTVKLTNPDGNSTWITGGILVGSARTFSTTGYYAGPVGGRSHVDDVGTAARLSYISKMWVNGNTMWLVEADTRTVRQLNLTNNTLSTVFGVETSTSTVTGTGTAASISGIASAWFDTSGQKLFLADLTGSGGFYQLDLSNLVFTSIFQGACSVTGIFADSTTVSFFCPAVPTWKQATRSSWVVSAGSSFFNGRNSFQLGSLSEDSTNYYLSSNSSSIISFSKSNGAAAFPSASLGAYTVTSDGTNLYFVPWDGTNTIKKMPIGGGTITTLKTAEGYTDTSGVTSVTAMAVAGNTLYYAVSMITQQGSYNSSMFSKVWSAIYSFNLTNSTTTLLAGAPSTIFGSAVGSLASTKFNPPGDQYFKNAPGMVVVNDTLYLADRGNHVIKKIQLDSGTSSLYAGTVGSSGYVNGNITNATFTNPAGLATDGLNLFVQDDSTIRKINIASGSVTLIAGNAGTTGTSIDGTGTAAKFYGASLGLQTDGTTVYSYERNSSAYELRKTTISTGTVTSVALNPTGVDPNHPRRGLILSPDKQTVYVAMYNKLSSFDIASNTLTDLVGGTGSNSIDGNSSTANFSWTGLVGSDGTYLYLVDATNTGGGDFDTSSCFRRVKLSTLTTDTLTTCQRPLYEMPGSTATAAFNTILANTVLYNGMLLIYNNVNIRYLQ